MPINLDRVHLAIASGVSGVCALCQNFWSAEDRGLDSCGERCGGPMSGGAFDKYKGPITDFSKFCFVCLKPATHAVRAKDNPRVLGCCQSHVGIISKYKPIDKPAVDIVVVSETGSSKVAAETVVPEKIHLKLSND